ncbi:MAG TPA: Ig-like domain-containing protein [Gemmatimonadales bacterium]|nr:Ig-like domain-containing protein [Gemmatimonadales bacterium]
MTGRRLLLSALLVSCGTAPDLPPGNGKPVLEDAMPDGDSQSGVVGDQLAEPLRVRVTSDGHPMQGVTVDWITPGSGADLQPPSSTSGSDGIVTAMWRMPQRAGPKFAMAVIRSGSSSAVEFTATALAATAELLSIESGDDQFGTVGETLPGLLLVSVLDGFGNPVKGALVEWQASSGGGTLSPPASTTDLDGIASALWLLGPGAGHQSGTARLSESAIAPVSFGATALAAPTAHVDVLVGNILFHPAAITIPAGASVTWTMVATGAIPHSVRSARGALFPSGPILLGAGQQYTHTFTLPGVYRYDCAIHGGAMSGTITVE